MAQLEHHSSEKDKQDWGTQTLASRPRYAIQNRWDASGFRDYAAQKPALARVSKRRWLYAGLLCLLSLLVAARSPLVPWFSSHRMFPVSHEAVSEYVEGGIDACNQPANPAPKSLNLTDNGRTSLVQWDSYSLVLKDQRIFLHSGEFHMFRLPVPSLWLDILQKFAAAGFNAVSIYTHMALINPAPGVIDFDGYRALKPLYEAAKQTGLWVVVRPGPYINAETTAGGIAHWITSQVAGELRTNSTDWQASWQDYIQGVIDETTPYQITEGGPVIAVQIDNEYDQKGFGHAEYFAQLEAAFHNSSIVVPLTTNDAGETKSWVNGTGAVDIYGHVDLFIATEFDSFVDSLDSYPQRFDCSNPASWNPVVTHYHTYHAAVNPSQPWYIPEFQGGAFDAWGPTAPGYEKCRELTGSDFESVFNLDLWASNAKMINYYMVYGGTSWGGLPFPGVYTSYDYGSAIAENRMLTSKYPELKRQGLFLRSSADFYQTDRIGDSNTGAVTVSDPRAFVTLLRNAKKLTSFYIVRQNDSTSTAVLDFKLTVNTSAGVVEIPRVTKAITLSGRQSKVIVADYSFGTSKVLYSTAQVLFAGQIGGRDVLFLHGDLTQEHETALVFKGTTRIKVNAGSVFFTRLRNAKETIVSFLSGIEGLVTLWDSDQQLILYSDSDTAGTFWSPVIPSSFSPLNPFENYWQFGANASVLVGGPYLVRNATISGTRLDLRGDLKDEVRLTVIAPGSIESLTWNGQPIQADFAASAAVTSQGGFVAQLRPFFEKSGLVPPVLSDWRYADSLPEIRNDFDDSNWTIADHTSTNLPFKPHYGDGRVLYGCDYGFCENIVLWRGHFNASDELKSVNLSINGGEAFAASVWVNDVFLNTSYGNSTNNRNILEETDDNFFFPDGALKYGQDNVITIVQDNMGLNESGSVPDEEKSPRGVRGFQLSSGNFGEWRVQGKTGGYMGYPDKIRGVLNEGGLYGERLGWHLPGFDTSAWVKRDISEGLPNSHAGVGFFATTFELHLPRGYDVPISFTFDQSSQPYRAYLFVNGWMMGKRVANLGPQYKFPVQQGILEYEGENTIVVALWAMDNTPVSPTLELTVDGLIEGGVGEVEVNNPLWSSEGRT